MPSTPDPVSAANATKKSLKRAMPPPTTIPRSKKAKVQQPISAIQSKSPFLAASGQTYQVSEASDTERPAAVSRSASKENLERTESRAIPNTLLKSSQPSTLLPPPRIASRFKPLVVGTRANVLTTTSTSRHRVNPSSPARTTPELLLPPQPYLDLPPADIVPILRPISLPPPLSQRKRVRCWAIILSELDNGSRKVCTLVSRTFRYAGP